MDKEKMVLEELRKLKKIILAIYIQLRDLEAKVEKKVEDEERPN